MWLESTKRSQVYAALYTVPMRSLRGTCFATVGTTQFDALIRTLLSDEVLTLLANQGYDRLVLQTGRGAEPVLPETSPLPVEW